MPKGPALEVVPGAPPVCVQCGLHGLTGCGERSKVELGRWDVGRYGRCRAEVNFAMEIPMEIDGTMEDEWVKVRYPKFWGCI